MGLSFVIPAISIGTSMAYSAVGYDFYMKKRNLDGTYVVNEDGIIQDGVNVPEREQDLSSNKSVNFEEDVAFTQDQGSLFGMSRLVTGVFKECNV